MDGYTYTATYPFGQQALSPLSFVLTSPPPLSPAFPFSLVTDGTTTSAELHDLFAQQQQHQHQQPSKHWDAGPVSTCSLPSALQPRPQRHSIVEAAPPTASASPVEEANQTLTAALEEMIENGIFDSFFQANGGLESFIDPRRLIFDACSGYDADDQFSDCGSEPEELGLGLFKTAAAALPAVSKPAAVRQRRHSIGTPGSGQLQMCPVPGCSKVFERAYSLQSHMKVHSTHKPHKCSECSAAFTRGHDLKRHMNTTHERMRAICCPDCKRSFSRQDALQRHKRIGACLMMD